MAMTDKKRKFADALLAGATKREAAIIAGYSPATAPQMGQKMAKDRDVVAYMVKARQGGDDQGTGQVATPDDDKPDRHRTMSLTGMFSDPKQFLLAVMNDATEDAKVRVDAAKTLIPYFHGKVAEAGKKQGRKDAAGKVAQGKFSAGEPPPAGRVVNIRPGQ